MSAQARKTAIVTGAARGIGKQIALRLGAEGFAVAVNYANSQTLAETVVAEIIAVGGSAIALRADITQPQAIATLFDQSEQTFGRVDVLINNAAVNLPEAVPIADTSETLYDQIMNVNARGTFFLLREAAQRLHDGGRIISLSSTAVANAYPGYAVYGASKVAIEFFTRVLAKELAGRRITVNAVAPGPTGTERFYQNNSEETLAKFRQAIPLHRLGTPEDIANIVAFLVSDQGGWINGQTIRANGGLV